VKFTKICILLALVMGFAAALSFPAQAYILDFDIPSVDSGAKISYAGGATPLVGLKLQIDAVSLLTDSDVLISGPYRVTGAGGLGDGTMNFTTGKFSTSVGNVWIFSGGGTITITGEIPGIGITTVETLMTGTFTDAQVVGPLSMKSNTGQVDGNFQDIKYAPLLKYFGLTVPQMDSGGFSVTITVPTGTTPPSGFMTTGVFSGNVLNTVVPLPPSVLLLGSGLLGLLALRGRRKS
jgi:hypothetical protein